MKHVELKFVGTYCDTNEKLEELFEAMSGVDGIEIEVLDVGDDIIVRLDIADLAMTKERLNLFTRLKERVIKFDQQCKTS